MRPWRLTIPAGLYAELHRHLFPGDGDEHGAVILAGTCESDRGLRLVARELHLGCAAEVVAPDSWRRAAKDAAAWH